MVENFGIVDGPPFVVITKHHVGDNGVAMKLRVHVAGRVVPEDAREHLLIANHILLVCLRVPDTRVQIAVFDISQCSLHRLVMGLDNALIAAHQRNDGNGLAGRECEIHAGAMGNLAIAVSSTHLYTIRIDAFHNVIEGFGIDIAGEARGLGALAKPLACFARFVAFLGVVAILPIVAARRLADREVRY